MFSTLESRWDGSAHRRQATLISFTIQALSVGLAIGTSMLWIGRPPQVRWLQLSPPPTFIRSEVAPAPAARAHVTTAIVRDLLHARIVPPQSHLPQTATLDDSKLAPPGPNLPEVDIRSSRGSSDAAPFGLGENVPVMVPPRPTISKPLVVSNLGTGSLLRRVQPTYPAIAREARVQGAVELRAIISKTGMIQNLIVVRGHPILATAAIEAVRQWRYRPYLLNNEPVEVETEVTVNFVLSGGSSE